jgi:hypothetical protein
MTKYYIKDGDSEKGPLTVDDLKKLKISKTTFIRQEENCNWVHADSLQELKIVFKSNFRLLKITGLTLIALIIIVAIVKVLSNINFGSSSSYEPFIEIEEPIPPPPTIDFSISKHEKKFLKELFKDCNLSGDKRQLVEACNYSNSRLRNKAVSIAGKDAGSYNLGQICDIFDHCYNNWKYVNDPIGNEIIEYASNTISNGLNGDCDDFAVLVCSMVLSIGGEARINFAYGQNGAHAFTEVNIGKTEVGDYISKRYKRVYDSSGIWTRTDKDGNKWLNIDWFAKHPGGKYFDYTHGTTFYIIQQYCNEFTK